MRSIRDETVIDARLLFYILVKTGTPMSLECLKKVLWPAKSIETAVSWLKSNDFVQEVDGLFSCKETFRECVFSRVLQSIWLYPESRPLDLVFGRLFVPPWWRGGKNGDLRWLVRTRELYPDRSLLEIRDMMIELETGYLEVTSVPNYGVRPMPLSQG
jgi:hypothetical protein